jgi:SAM-dependent methyltransferase
LSSNQEIYKRKDCRLCSSQDLELILPLTPTPPGDLYLKPQYKEKNTKCYPIDLHICHKCGYVHLRDTLSASQIYPDYLYETTSSSGLVNHFAAYAKEVKEKLPYLMNGLVIDVGSNDGTLLKHFKNMGFSTLGIDPAQTAATRAQENGIETIIDFFNEDSAQKIKGKYGKAQIITANNMFANIDDLDGFITSVKSILSCDGVFIIEFAYLGDLIKNHIFDYIYHEHLSYFSVEALETFFTKHGMRMLHLTHSSSKGGSYRSYFCLNESEHTATENLDAFREEEYLLKLKSKKTYSDLDKLTKSNAVEVLEIILDHKAKGGTCVGYGASVTCTTLLYHFGIGDKLDYLVDDNPAKIGTVSPGYHLPVYSSDQLVSDKPSLCVILAWRYAHEIYNKNSSKKSGDTKFLLPMPKVELR